MADWINAWEHLQEQAMHDNAKTPPLPLMQPGWRHQALNWKDKATLGLWAAVMHSPLLATTLYLYFHAFPRPWAILLGIVLYPVAALLSIGFHRFYNSRMAKWIGGYALAVAPIHTSPIAQPLAQTMPLARAFEEFRDRPDAQLQLMTNLGRLLAQTHNQGWIVGDVYHAQYTVGPNLKVRQADTRNVVKFNRAAREWDSSREIQLRAAVEFLTSSKEPDLKASGLGDLAHVAFLLSYYETLDLPKFARHDDNTFIYLYRLMEKVAEHLDKNPDGPLRDQARLLLQAWQDMQRSSSERSLLNLHLLGEPAHRNERLPGAQSLRAAA